MSSVGRTSYQQYGVPPHARPPHQRVSHNCGHRVRSLLPPGPPDNEIPLYAGLGIFVDPPENSVSIRASDARRRSGLGVTFATFTAIHDETLPPQAVDKLHIDFIAFTPREQVVHFGGDLSMEALREILPTIPGIKELHVTDVAVSDGFLQPDPDGQFAGAKLLPSLRHLHLERVVRNHYDWNNISHTKHPAARSFRSLSLGNASTSANTWRRT